MAEISWYKTGQSEPHERNIRACRFVVDRTHKPCGGHLSLEQAVAHMRVTMAAAVRTANKGSTGTTAATDRASPTAHSTRGQRQCERSYMAFPVTDPTIGRATDRRPSQCAFQAVLIVVSNHWPHVRQFRPVPKLGLND